MLCRFCFLLLVGLRNVVVSEPELRFDIEEIISLSEVGNVRLVGTPRCLVAKAFVLTDALEISHELVTGEKRTFSVQEFVDCHHYRCNARSITYYVDWLQVNDRLAPADKYTNYRSRPYSCRAGMAPDGLTHIRITGYKNIHVEEFEDQITTYGSVIACIDTSEVNCYAYRNYRDGIIDGFSSEVCHTPVLIVGYTELYYRVRTSNGAEWGEHGYFRILRGGNKCGIEGRMAVLMTKPRENKPGINATTGCPEDYPEYCPMTKTCRASDQVCLTGLETVQAKKQKEEDEERRRPNAYIYDHRRKRSEEEDDDKDDDGLCKDHPGFPCHAIQSRHCGHPKVRRVCGGACGVCGEDGTAKCKDMEEFEGECRAYIRYCRAVPALRLKCPWTCNVHPSDCESANIYDNLAKYIRYTPPPTGFCYKPTILNGRVTNSRTLLNPGEKVDIVCRAGYTLVGDPTYCEIQNVFRPDSRRMQSCMRFGGEDFEGKGAGYIGRRTNSSTGEQCENWLTAAHTGTFHRVERGRTLLQGGNHNYCRNIGDDFLPFCYTRSGQLKEYCFSLPKCGGTESDPCSSPRTNVYDCVALHYSPAKCAIRNELQLAQVQWFWEKCNAMCCEYAGCQ